MPTQLAHLWRHVGGGARAGLQGVVLRAVPDGQPKVCGLDWRVRLLPEESKAGHSSRAQGRVMIAD
jgi:hypothetical protein